MSTYDVANPFGCSVTVEERQKALQRMKISHMIVALDVTSCLQPCTLKDIRRRLASELKHPKDCGVQPEDLKAAIDRVDRKLVLHGR